MAWVHTSGLGQGLMYHSSASYPCVNTTAFMEVVGYCKMLTPPLNPRASLNYDCMCRLFKLARKKERKIFLIFAERFDILI